RALLEIVDRLSDSLAVDPALLLGVAEEEAVIADDVDEPWNPTRIFRDPAHRRIGEHTQVARTRDAQPGPDILARFARGQRRDLAAQPDPLLELLELGEVELGLQLRLTHEQNLEELVRRGLEVREQPDLFQRRGF